MREMMEKSSEAEHVQALEANMSDLNTALEKVSSKLQEAAVELNKEKARNRSVGKHTEVRTSIYF